MHTLQLERDVPGVTVAAASAACGQFTFAAAAADTREDGCACNAVGRVRLAAAGWGSCDCDCDIGANMAIVQGKVRWVTLARFGERAHCAVPLDRAKNLFIVRHHTCNTRFNCRPSSCARSRRQQNTEESVGKAV